MKVEKVTALVGKGKGPWQTLRSGKVKRVRIIGLTLGEVIVELSNNLKKPPLVSVSFNVNGEHSLPPDFRYARVSHDGPSSKLICFLMN